MATAALRRQVEKLTEELRRQGLAGPSPEPDPPEKWSCPRCGQRGLAEPNPEQLQTLEGWTAAELGAASDALCQWAACLLWCPTCGRLVASGCHSPDWRRQWWANDIGIGLATNIWHMELLRELCVAALAVPGGSTPGKAAAAPPPPPPTSGAADDEEWVWLPDGADADVGQAQEGEGGR
jgi:hypothetical protein